MTMCLNRLAISTANRHYFIARIFGLAVLLALTLSSTATAISLTNVVSRKTHATVGTFDLPLITVPAANGGVSVEPRAPGAGHLIVFTFDEPVTAPGMVTALDAGNAPIGNVAVPVVMGNEVQVMLADVPNRRRVKMTLTGVTGASGVTNATVTLGFLIGDFNDSGAVAAQDTSAGKARAGQVIDANTFRYDINASGQVSAADIAATKSRAGLAVVSGALPLAWQQGGWDLDLWQ